MSVSASLSCLSATWRRTNTHYLKLPVKNSFHDIVVIVHFLILNASFMRYATCVDDYNYCAVLTSYFILSEVEKYIDVKYFSRKNLKKSKGDNTFKELTNSRQNTN